MQLAGVALAPLLPGTIQTLKARLQGRRGPSPLQPYRTLRRLWRKSAVDPEGTGVGVPARAGAGRRVPAARAGDRPGRRAAPARFGLGHDALVLVGLLALARFAIAAAAWDTGSGFALMGAARDLTFAVFGEALLVLALLRRGAPGAQHRPARDERRGGRRARLERAGPLVRRVRVRARGPASRPAASRSTTPTPISS